MSAHTDNLRRDLRNGRPCIPSLPRWPRLCTARVASRGLAGRLAGLTWQSTSESSRISGECSVAEKSSTCPHPTHSVHATDTFGGPHGCRHVVASRGQAGD